MLIERAVEEKIVELIRELEIDGVEVVGSRQIAAEGEVKNEGDEKAVIAVAINLRAHDDFTLPTINVGGAIAVTTRSETSANGALHDTIIEALVKLFDVWHRNGEAFSSALSNDEFFAAELRMDGGGNVTYDQARGAWVETFSFTIRGTVLDHN